MRNIPASLQSQVFSTSLPPPLIVESMERIELLVPGLAQINTGSLQTHALAYAEHYRHHILYLENEWDFLVTALFDAWQHEKYKEVVQLVTALAYPASRRDNLTEAQRILQLGIAASRKIQDREHLASFLSCLGGLLFSHGKYQRGWRLWQTALHFTGTLAGLWEPLSSFTQIADILGSYTASRQFVETIQSREGADRADCLAVALFIRGLYARWGNDLIAARMDFKQCLSLLIQTTPAPCFSPSRQLFCVAVQIELARAQGQYKRAQTYTETALSLAQTFSNLHTVATLLIDQGFFAFEQNQFADLSKTCRSLRQIAPQINMPNVFTCMSIFEQSLEEQLLPHEMARSSSPHPPVSNNAHHLLSAREIEVLQLVASGLSNREIAEQLVVTTGTVKKHLEHIYIRLDVHSRTSALLRAQTLGIITQALSTNSR